MYVDSARWDCTVKTHANERYSSHFPAIKIYRVNNFILWAKWESDFDIDIGMIES